MTIAGRMLNQVKTTQNKEEKMNARRGFCVMCVLVVGLSLVLESVALAGPPSLSNHTGEVPLYGGTGYPVVPKARVQLYQAADSKMPSFYRGSNSNRRAKRQVRQAHPGLLGNLYEVPEVRVPQYYPKDYQPRLAK